LLPAIDSIGRGTGDAVNGGSGKSHAWRLHRVHGHGIMLAAFAGLACASSARAFSDPFSYQADVLAGGGGGRWFTGSTADGYGCEVCHEGGPVADLSVAGLPIDGFSPGASYEIVIGWPSAEHVALLAELTDEARMGVGGLELPRPEATPESERCSGELLGAPSSAVHVLADSSLRQLVSVVDCGARQVRFRWTAPLTAPEAVWLHVGFITSNEDTTPMGDGVTMARRVLLREGASREAEVVAQGCSTLPERSTLRAHSALAPFVVILVGLGWSRSRRTLEALR
jgi:hypothetical protein